MWRTEDQTLTRGDLLCHIRYLKGLTPHLVESNRGVLKLISVVLTLKLLDETVVCDHSNESY